ncbi:MAG TPA: cytochrome c oxidase assembly factor Coa1 family protein [Xanthomonadaceae bacterium]|jgi:hypothetical protein|nr:cytochrome c oxidase assembly factor Coa1 family protein [Xanthomonadaceae bacterium]
MNSTMTENTSGQGSNATVPPEIHGWNWGAFLLTWIWGIGNNVLLALLTLVPIVGLVMWIVLGVKGSEWAWQQKRWDSVEHFRRVQRAWAKWGVVVWLACIVLSAIFVALIFFVVTAAMKGSEPYRMGVDRLHADTAAMTELGTPVTTSFPSGSIHVLNDEGTVDFRIAVHGTSKSGVLYIRGERSEDRWHYDRVDLVIGSQHIDLGSEQASGRDDSGP